MTSVDIADLFNQSNTSDFSLRGGSSVDSISVNYGLPTCTGPDDAASMFQMAESRYTGTLQLASNRRFQFRVYKSVID